MDKKHDKKDFVSSTTAGAIGLFTLQAAWKAVVGWVVVQAISNAWGKAKKWYRKDKDAKHTDSGVSQEEQREEA